MPGALSDSPAAALTPLLRRAGRIALDAAAEAVAVRKADGSVVTEADRRAEDVLVEGLRHLFPDDAIVGEEGTHVAGRSDATWFVDPLDGTTAYLEGFAYWGPTICRAVGQRWMIGVFHLPRLGEMYHAERGRGAWLDGRRLRSHDVPVTADSALCLPSRYHLRAPLPWPGRVRALGSTAAHLSLVARGAAVAAVVPWYSPWDIGCGVLLVQEAGRLVVTLDGRAVDGPRPGRPLPVLAGASTPIGLLREGLRGGPLDRTPRDPRPTSTPTE